MGQPRLWTNKFPKIDGGGAGGATQARPHCPSSLCLGPAGPPETGAVGRKPRATRHKAKIRLSAPREPRNTELGARVRAWVEWPQARASPTRDPSLYPNILPTLPLPPGGQLRHWGPAARRAGEEGGLFPVQLPDTPWVCGRNPPNVLIDHLPPTHPSESQPGLYPVNPSITLHLHPPASPVPPSALSQPHLPLPRRSREEASARRGTSGTCYTFPSGSRRPRQEGLTSGHILSPLALPLLPVGYGVWVGSLTSLGLLPHL